MDDENAIVFQWTITSYLNSESDRPEATNEIVKPTFLWEYDQINANASEKFHFDFSVHVLISRKDRCHLKNESFKQFQFTFEFTREDNATCPCV